MHVQIDCERRVKLGYAKAREDDKQVTGSKQIRLLTRSRLVKRIESIVLCALRKTRGSTMAKAGCGKRTAWCIESWCIHCQHQAECMRLSRNV